MTIQKSISQPPEFNDNACFRSDQEIIDLAKFAGLNSTFHALSDPLRLQVVELLRSQELCVGQLRDQLEVSPSKLSFHLKQLKEANLLLSRHEGRWIYYRLNLAQFVVLEQYLDVAEKAQEASNNWISAPQQCA